MNDADAVLAFYESYGALLTERQLEHISHPRLQILEQPYDLAPKLFSICQLCEEYEHLLSRRRLAELCKAAADQNWKLVQARLLRTTRQLEFYREVWEIELRSILPFSLIRPRSLCRPDSVLQMLKQ